MNALFRAAAYRPTSSLLGRQTRALSGAPGGKAKFMLVSNNEDFRVERFCLDRAQAPPNSLRVLHITGGADTTLTSLMHPSVGHMVSADMNPQQLHLLHLKLAVATSALPAEQAAGFLLRGEGGEKVLTEELAAMLPADTLQYFLGDAVDETTFGILRAENDNVFNKTIRAWFETEHGLDLGGFHSMADTEKDRVLSICATNDCATLATTLQTVFKAAPWFQNMAPEMQTQILSVIDIAAVSNLRGIGAILTAMDSGLVARGEFHTDILLTGAPKTLPPWLSERGRRLLRSKVAEGRLETFLGPIAEMKETERFDFVSLSNIYDFVTEEEAVASIRAVKASILKPGGEILVRKAVGHAPEALAKAGGDVMAGEALENHDRAQLFFKNAGTVASARFA